MSGHSANIAAWPVALTAHIFFGPKRSTSLPIGSAARKAAAPAQVRPRPTWAAVSPTIWVKNTADPVMKVPSPRAKRRDWSARRPASGDGGRAWRRREANIAAILPSSITRVARFSLAAGRPRVGERPVEAAEQRVAEARRDQVEDLADVAGEGVHGDRPVLQRPHDPGRGLLRGECAAAGVRLGGRDHRRADQREAHVG